MALENFIVPRREFKHFETYELFKSKKVSANKDNTSYYVGNASVPTTGDPEILWGDYVIIKDRELIWTRGRIYDKSRNLGKLSSIAKNAFNPRLDKAIITIVDEGGRSYLDTGGIISVYKSHNKLPSLSIVPQFIISESGTDASGNAFTTISLDRLLRLIDDGCDIINQSYSSSSSIYATGASVSSVVNDLKNASEWFADNAIVTNCFNYPNNVYDSNIVEVARGFEAYAIHSDGTMSANAIDADNMKLNKVYLTDSNLASIKSAIDQAVTDKLWLIIATKSISGTLSSSTIDEVLTYIEGKSSAEYLQMTDALNARGSLFNLTTASGLDFKLYKDGKLDADLSKASQENLEFSYTSPEYKDEMMTYVASELSYYASLALEDGSLLETEKYERIDVTGLGTFIISESTIEFDYTDDVKFKQPMMSYIESNSSFDSMNDSFKNETVTYMQNNIDFNNMSAEFKAALMEYVVANWPAKDGSLFLMADNGEALDLTE